MITLRKYKQSDYENFKALVSDSEVMKNVDGVLPQNVIDKLFPYFLNGGENFNDDVWAIETAQNDQYIGHCALIDLKEEENTRDIIFYIAKEHWQKGYGKGVAKKMLEVGFKEFGYSKITASVDSDHTPSIKILETLCLSIERWEEEDGIKWPIYSILKEKFLAT